MNDTSLADHLDFFEVRTSRGKSGTPLGGQGFFSDFRHVNSVPVVGSLIWAMVYVTKSLISPLYFFVQKQNLQANLVHVLCLCVTLALFWTKNSTCVEIPSDTVTRSSSQHALTFAPVTKPPLQGARVRTNWRCAVPWVSAHTVQEARQDAPCMNLNFQDMCSMIGRGGASG